MVPGTAVRSRITHLLLTILIRHTKAARATRNLAALPTLLHLVDQRWLRFCWMGRS